MKLPIRTCLGIVSVALFLGICHSPATTYAETYAPQLAPASDEAQQKISSFGVPEGFRIEVAAAEPNLASPVAICFDQQGRLLVCESYRANNGVLDNRSFMQWLDQDLQAQTVEDRAEYIRRNFANEPNRFTEHHDRLRLLEDRDGDGVFEHATVFADGFNDPLDGVGAGVLAWNGDVYYTCIPRLWKLRDTKNTGQADERVSLHRGYGVRWAFFGHDLHGLCLGPDGKLYYSIGDRGYHVEQNGKTFARPDRGAVFRCNLDGSDLEVVATGLRNPQELAFDQYGNLFTGDNNSDSGDAARWVFVVEGADTGWRMHYQYLGDRGPWNRERLWHTRFAQQAAYILPPVKHIPSGPSGLTYNPGVGLPESLAGTFLLCDFHGAAGGSGVNTLAMKPQGAFWEVTEIKPLVSNLLATDVTFGPDSAIYISDWVHGWSPSGKGRIYRVVRPEIASDPLRLETRKLLLSDLREKSPEEPAELLGHADMRVRLAAQFALADRGPEAAKVFEQTLSNSDNQLARLHAIWGLGQIGRQTPAVLSAVLAVLNDADAEVRSQAVKVLGDCKYQAAAEPLIAALEDSSPRVAYLAAQSLGKLQTAAAVDPLVGLLKRNNDEDVVVRHAASLALARCAQAEQLAPLSQHESTAVRLAAVVALRHQQSPSLDRFLTDAAPQVVLEAALAIHDLPVQEAWPALAAQVNRSFTGDDLQRDAFWRRVLNVQFRLGTPASALAVAEFAVRQDVPQSNRLDALQMLADWAEPAQRDRVLGEWRPLERRDAAIATDALRATLPRLLVLEGDIRQHALQLAAKLGLPDVAPLLVESIQNGAVPAAQSVSSLRALDGLQDDKINDVVDKALTDTRPEVRAAALSIVARRRPEQALPLLEKVLTDGTIGEQQAALAALETMPAGKADELVQQALEHLLAGKLPAEAELELLTSAAARPHEGVKQLVERYQASRDSSNPLAAYQEALAGGNAEEGRRLFFQKAEVYCVRCHKAGGVGGDVGPDLSHIGKDKSREYLLEAIVTPNAAVAKGFDSVTLMLDDGRVVSGIVREENEEQLKLITPEGQVQVVDKATIEDRAASKSAMPEDLVNKLSRRELRDLIEFLATPHAAAP